MVQVNVVEIENAQQHVRVPLRVVREHKVTVALEPAVDSAYKLDRDFLVRVPVRIAHVGAFVDQHVIEHITVAVWNIPQPFAEVREVLRSEEHTSELQSQSNLVCRLLLEKKNI